MCADAKTAGLRVGIGAFALGLCSLASQNVTAFNYPLQAEHVREAYFLGRTTNNEKLIDFFKQYVHEFPFPARGPYFSYVESVEFRTPYEQVVLRSRQNLNQYSSLEADKDYRAHPNLIVVRVLISYMINYVGPIQPTSSFKVRVSQADLIEPKKLTTESICSVSWHTDCGVTRFAILLSFSAEQFASGIADVNVETPDGQILRTEFDLDKLI
jgi:hypothetical protein